jgi:PEP-CTERM motif
MALSTLMKKLLIATVGAASIVGVAGAAQAASLIGDTIKYEYIFPNASSVYEIKTTTVAAGTSDAINAVDIFSINPEATSFLINNFAYNSNWNTAAFNGFRLSDLNFDTPSKITGVTFVTNMQGFNGSRIGFTDNSVSVNWNSLRFNSNTFLNLSLKTTAVPEPASTLGLLAVGALGAGSLLKRKKGIVG